MLLDNLTQANAPHSSTALVDRLANRFAVLLTSAELAIEFKTLPLEILTVREAIISVWRHCLAQDSWQEIDQTVIDNLLQKIERYRETDSFSELGPCSSIGIAEHVVRSPKGRLGWLDTNNGEEYCYLLPHTLKELAHPDYSKSEVITALKNKLGISGSERIPIDGRRQRVWRIPLSERESQQASADDTDTYQRASQGY